MRIAVLSDVHGNTPALRAVLDEVATLRADLVLDLGDIASGAVDPRGTLDLRRSTPGVQGLRGNHERQLLTVPVDAMTASDRTADAVLREDDRRWLAALPARLRPLPRVLAFHGAPDDDLQYLLHTAAPTGLRPAKGDEVLERLGGYSAARTLFLCGHTHLPGVRRSAGERLVVNPGSVGWPAYTDDLPNPHVVESGDPRARYAVVETAADGGPPWDVDLRAVEYDVDAAVAAAHAHGRPEVAFALRHGRVTPEERAAVVAHARAQRAQAGHGKDGRHRDPAAGRSTT